MHPSTSRPEPRWARRLLTLGAVGALALGGAAGPAIGADAAAPATNPPKPTCTATSLQATVSAGTTIVTAKPLTTPNTHTAYCRVDGYVVTSGPGGQNHVNFQVSLPDTFAKRYLFIGIGGAAGAVTDPDEQQLAAGWAQASTDAGNQGTILDYRFATDRTKALDWASRGVHVSTTETQAITRAYYGLSDQPRQLNRYISGCSGGGRMGLVEASLYPAEYDGVLAGAPGTNNLNILKFGQIVDYLLHHPDSWVSPDQLQQLETAIVKANDATDGAGDGFVRDPGKIKLDFAALGQFTPAQIDLLKLVTTEFRVGSRSYPGFSASNPTGWASFLIGTVPPAQWATQPPAGLILFDTVTRGLFGADYDFTTQFDFASQADLQNWDTTFQQVFPDQNADPAKFDTFRQRGGKLLIYHGASDNGISVFDTISFYQRLADRLHGYPATQQSARLFTVPGMWHCFGGPGPQDTPTQALASLVNWVERGQAPQTITVHSAPNQPTASFLLCPYPSRGVFAGGVDNPRHLNPLDATTWTCRA